MLRRILQSCCFCLFLASSFLLPTSTYAAATIQQHVSTSHADFPAVDPNYIYDQLFYMATHYQRREAGYDTNLPPEKNGHDEFADYWAKEMLHNLQGFGAQVRRDPFEVQGWQGRPAVVPAFNVEVSIPGAIHPEQIVVIGCHYDGEGISTQSANDDASGCAIELGIARAMANFWRDQFAYPARTLRFVIFDAEEQGLFGSFHYLNSTINGDASNVVAMFNEEQNGIAYPLRYLGNLSNPLLPLFIAMSPLQSNPLYPAQDKLSPIQRANLTHFHMLMQQAIPAVFKQFQALGYTGLTYHGPGEQEVAQPIFTADHLNHVIIQDDKYGGSDQIPFTLAGLPCATFAGNSTYYDRNPPAWSYPYDQREDTIQLMNTFASGSSKKSNALALALALPGMLTTWMLNQPDILGQSTIALPRGPLAAIGDIGSTQADTKLTLDAQAFDPQADHAPLTYAWDFGDGSHASGTTVSHTYSAPGSYTLTLLVTSPTGARSVTKTLTVVAQPTIYSNPYAHDQQDGSPPPNPSVIYPIPDDTLSDKIVNLPAPASGNPAIPVSQSSTNAQVIATFLPLIAGGFVIVLLVVAGVCFLLIRKSWRSKKRFSSS